MGSDSDKKDGKVAAEEIQDGKIIDDRSCTDPCMIILTAVFVIGWIIILSVAVAQGKPSRIIMPSNFRGDLCGDLPPLVDYPNIWIPRPSRLSYGLCVPRCPSVGDKVCNNDIEPMVGNASVDVPNHFYSHTGKEYNFGFQSTIKCFSQSCSAVEQYAADRFFGLEVKLRQYKCFSAFYASGATLFRCLPFQDERDNITLAQALGEGADTIAKLADFLGVGSFFNRGFSETEQSWLVILLCSLTCCVISLLWIFLLRWIMKPLIYLCILLIFALLILIGYLAMLMADDLEKVALPGDTATQDQVRFWRALQWAAWILAAVYFVVMLWMIKRIKIAIAIMREASYVFLNSPGLALVPPIVFILFMGWVAFFIVTTVYIQTIGTLQDGVFTEAAKNTFGETAVNFTLLAANQTTTALNDYNVTNSTVNTTEWTTDQKIRYLHMYNFFGFLWASNFCIMYGFFVMAMTGAVYYFSATQSQRRMLESSDPEEKATGVDKHVPYFTIPKAVWAGLRYNLGTILFGSLLIALIQFVRAMFLYFKEQFLEEWAETATIGCLIKCIEYCLWYIQKVVEIISKNAFIVCCVKCTSFCNSAGRAMSLIGANGARVGVLTTLSTVACFVLKVFIVGTNMIIAWALINEPALTQNKPVESGLFPLLGILIISFIIASVFVNVYEACVDTVLICFLLDEEDYAGTFLSDELAELVGMFEGAELARRDYEKKLREASSGKKAEPQAE